GSRRGVSDNPASAANPDRVTDSVRVPPGDASRIPQVGFARISTVVVTVQNLKIQVLSPSTPLTGRFRRTGRIVNIGGIYATILSHTRSGLRPGHRDPGADGTNQFQQPGA